MKLGDFINYEGAAFPVYPALLRKFGTKETVFLCRLIWWHRSEDDWIDKSVADIEFETGLSYKEQLNVRKSLVEQGILEEEYRRLDHALLFRVKRDILGKELDQIGVEAYAQREDGHMPEGKEAYAQREDGTCPKGRSTLLKTSKRLNKTLARTAHPDTKTFTNAWCEAYEKHFGRPYAFNGSIDGKAVRELLAIPGMDWSGILALALKAWSKPMNSREFFHAKRAVTISGLRRYWNEIRAELEPRQRAIDYSNGF